MCVKLSVLIRSYEFILRLSGWVSSESMFFKKPLNLQDEHHGCFSEISRKAFLRPTHLAFIQESCVCLNKYFKIFCKPRKSLVFFFPFTLIFRTLLANNNSCFEIYASVARLHVFSHCVMSHHHPLHPDLCLITCFFLCSFQVVTPCCQVSIQLFHLELVFGPVSHKENESYTFRMRSPCGS